MSAAAYEDLCQKVTHVIHSGAYVNHVQPYSAHKVANVDGSKHILQLVMDARRPVRITHLSSVGALTRDMLQEVNGEPTYLESNTKLGTQHLAKYDGYSQSKWVSENLMHQANERGFEVRIVRVAFISGHSFTGQSNPADMMCRLLRSFVELKKAPIMDPSHKMDMTPVNWAAKALAYLAVDTSSSKVGTTFHLVSPNHSITVSELVRCVRQKGYSVEEIPYDDWCQLVRDTPSTAFAPLVSRLARKGGSPSHRMSSTQLRLATQACEGLPRCDLSEAALAQCLSWLQAQALLTKARL